jgi:hypothetical protein
MTAATYNIPKIHGFPLLKIESEKEHDRATALAEHLMSRPSMSKNERRILDTLYVLIGVRGEAVRLRLAQGFSARHPQAADERKADRRRRLNRHPWQSKRRVDDPDRRPRDQHPTGDQVGEIFQGRCWAVSHREVTASPSSGSCLEANRIVRPLLDPSLLFLERLRIAHIMPPAVAEGMKQKSMLNQKANLLPLRDIRRLRRLELAMHPRRRPPAQRTRPRRKPIQRPLERSPAVTADERKQPPRIRGHTTSRHNIIRSVA